MLENAQLSVSMVTTNTVQIKAPESFRSRAGTTFLPWILMGQSLQVKRHDKTTAPKTHQFAKVGHWLEAPVI